MARRGWAAGMPADGYLRHPQHLWRHHHLWKVTASKASAAGSASIFRTTAHRATRRRAHAAGAARNRQPKDNCGSALGKAASSLTRAAALRSLSPHGKTPSGSSEMMKKMNLTA